jgi:hypothetical protein
VVRKAGKLRVRIIHFIYIMFDKLSETVNKVNQTMNTVDNLQYTANRAEGQMKNASTATGGWLKWAIIGVIVVAALLYFVFGM